MQQKTLNAPVLISGIGLHSGKPIEMRLLPAEVNSGVTFVRVDQTPPVVIKAEPLAVNDTRMATTVNNGSVFVSTIEHLMSAFSGLEVDNVTVEINAAETPIMDGSGLEFVTAIQRVGLKQQTEPRRYVRILKPVEVTEGDKWARLDPADDFTIKFDIDFKHPVVDRTRQSAKVSVTAESYVTEVAYARTFGFVKDLEMLRKMGLAQGGRLENAVVVDTDKILNPEGLRADDEFVKHKMLDAMGDLYVLGYPLKAHYSAFKSGHAINNKLLRAVLADASAWRLEE